MEISALGEDRFLKKDPDQQDQTKGTVYTAINPKPKVGDDQLSKRGLPNQSQEDGGAPNILTGTVIVSCFIQTSALPSRIELQGNDLTFFDDTYEKDGQVIGDTSRLIFTHGSGKKGEVITAGFILEKRASIYNTYDNVLSWFSPEPPAGAHNYLFIGRDAYSAGTQQRNISSIHFAINSDSTFVPLPDNNPLNGIFEVEYSVDHQFKTRLIYIGNSATLFPGAGIPGYSSVIIGGEGGLVGLGYTPAAGGLAVLIYALSESELSLGADLIPDADDAYDIGSASFRIKDLYIAGTIHGGGGGGTTVYAGIIDSGGMTGTLPSGWSVSKLGTGDYVVTHNLGVPNSVVGSAAAPAMSLSSNDNSFEVQCTNLGGFATDSAVNFLLVVL